MKELNTQRLVLRSLLPTDAATIQFLRSNEKVNTYLNRPATVTFEEAMVFIQKINTSIATGQSYYWAICTMAELSLLGTICLWNLEPELGKAEIGFELLPDWQGFGIMQESATAVMEFAFSVLSVTTIIAMVHPQNKASVALLQKLQFVKDEMFQFVQKENADGLDVYVCMRTA